MAATYDSSQIATSLVAYARARFRDVGGLEDTVVTKPLMQDEEYLGFIEAMGPREGLATAAEALAAGFAQKLQRFSQAGGIDVTWPRRAEFYYSLAKSIRDNGLGEIDATGSLYAWQPETPTPCNDERLAFL